MGHSVGGLFCVFGSLRRGLGHYFFDFGGVAWETFAQEFVTRFGDQDIIFDAHTEIFLGDIDARLHGDNHARLERFAGVTGIVNIEANVVAEGS